MRVLVVNTLYPPNLVGGAERSVADLAAALAALDATVTVLSITHGERRVEVANGVEARYVPLRNIFWPYASGREPWWERRVWHLVDFHNPAMQAEVAAAIRETAPDIVHTNNLQGFSTAAWTAAFSAGVPIVHTLRDHYLTCARTTRWRGDQVCARTCVSCMPFLVARRRASTQVTAVVGVSRHILDLHLELGFFPAARTRRVIYRTPSSIAASPRIVARGQPIARVLGRLVPIKGAALLVRAVQAGGPFELRVAGDGDPAFVASLRAMARGAPVTFSGTRRCDVLSREHRRPRRPVPLARAAGTGHSRCARGRRAGSREQPRRHS